MLDDGLTRAKRGLEGLATGDAFGELFFTISPHHTFPSELPTRTWRWTDDTHMALSVLEVLKDHGRIDQDALARAFARRYVEQPYRGYGSGAARLLQAIARGENWRQAAPALFNGGSYGNGAAMRAAPVGAFFFHDPRRAAHEAQLSAAVTHAHIEGQAGAIAVAAAAAIAANALHPSGIEFLQQVIAFLPESITRSRAQMALGIPAEDLPQAARILGTGREISAQDTVPFCLWSTAYHLDDYEEALWWTVKGMGDRDTTCAIVGGIVALSAPEIPPDWMKRREPIPDL